jgi:hypothetical protein
MRAALNTWQEHMVQMRKQQDVLYKAVMCWDRIGTLRALNQWNWQLQQAQIRQEVMYKAMFRWASNSLARAFDTWRFKAGGEISEEESLMMAAQHHKFSCLSSYLSHWRVITQVSLQQDMYASDKRALADQHRDISYLRTAFLNWNHFVSENVSEAPSASPAVSPQLLPSSNEPISAIARAVDPYGLFSCIVGGTTYGKQDRALYYVVEVTLEGRTTFNLNKRYRDFDVLNNVVTDRFGAILRNVSGGAPALPPKKSFKKGDPDFYENRTAELHQFLQQLIAISEIAGSEELCEFLQFHAHL